MAASRHSGMSIQRPALPGKPLMQQVGGKMQRRYLVQTREDFRFDSVLVPSGAFTKVTFFRNVSGKGQQYTDMDEDNAMPRGEVMKVNRMGLVFAPYYGNTVVLEADIKKLIAGTYLKLRLNKNDYRVKPPMFWQVGVGLVGQTAGAGGEFFLSIGVPSLQATPPLKEPFDLANEKGTHDVIEATLELDSTNLAGGYGAPTLAGNVLVAFVFQGLVYTAGVKS